MIREGHTVPILDSKTHDDLTGVILAQIILDFHPERMEMFPVPVLHQMIRANTIVLGFLREYFRQALQYMYFWQRLGSLGTLSTPLDWMKTFIPTESPKSPPNPPPPPEDLTETLARRVAELERQLAEMKKPGT